MAQALTCDGSVASHATKLVRHPLPILGPNDQDENHVTYTIVSALTDRPDMNTINLKMTNRHSKKHAKNIVHKKPAKISIGQKTQTLETSTR